MIKKILIGLEGSVGTDRATELALSIAKANQASLVGLAIIDEPDIKAGAAMGIGGSSYKHQRDQTLLLEAHQQARDFEQRFLAKARAASVTARAVEVTGKPAETILAELDNHDIGLLGRYANFRFETEAIDLRTWDVVVHQAAKPLIIVPESDLPSGRAVVLAYDGSAASKRALRVYVGTGLASDRDVHVVTVNDSGAVAWELATEASQELGALGVAAEVHNVVSVQSIAEALLQVAVKIDASLIVMGAFAHSRLRNLFRGSVTQQLVEKTTIPLFLTH
jgi:nucleotide-binding universal stress UspA family protein